MQPPAAAALAAVPRVALAAPVAPAPVKRAERPATSLQRRQGVQHGRARRWRRRWTRGEAAFVRRCGSRLPAQLSEHEATFVVALSVAELAEWKLVSGETAAAATLSLHCAQLLDALLSGLAPAYDAAAPLHGSATAGDDSVAAPVEAPGSSSNSSAMFDVPLNPTEGSIDDALEGYSASEGLSGASGPLTSRSFMPGGQMSTEGSGAPELPRAAADSLPDSAAEMGAALESVLARVPQCESELCKAALLRMRVMLAHGCRLAAEAEQAQVRASRTCKLRTAILPAQ